MSSLNDHNARMATLRSSKSEAAGRRSAMLAAEARLRKTHSYELNRKNFCTKCFMILNTAGNCSMGC